MLKRETAIAGVRAKHMSKAGKSKKSNIHLGGSFDGFLNEEGVFGAVQTTAVKRVLAMKLSEAIEKYNLTKVEMAEKIGVSGVQL